MLDDKFIVHGDYNCDIKSGEEIKLERSLYGLSDNLQVELDLVLSSDYNKKLIELQEEEMKVFEEMKKS